MRCRRWLHAVTLFLLYDHIGACDDAIKKSVVEVHSGWKACRATAEVLARRGCRNVHSPEQDTLVFNVSRLPTTALTVLIENEQFKGSRAENLGLDDLYFSTNLQLYPDIHDVGRDFYTLLFERDLDNLLAQVDGACVVAFKKSTKRHILRFAGINYRAKAWLDGTELPELEGFAHAGMFRRRSFDVTNGSRFALLIEPPDHPGRVPPDGGGQGGNHELAMDGAVPQYMLGWDWCQAMPDRATGFYGSVSLESTVLTSSTSISPSWMIRDAAVQTVSLQDCSIDMVPEQCSSIVLQALAHIEGDQPPELFTIRIESDWGESWLVSDSNPSTSDPDIEAILDVKNPQAVRLWWPHGIGLSSVAALHRFTFTLSVNGTVVDVQSIQVGIRTVETWLDEELQGQRFKINGQDVYVVGGNWIGTDQALRYSASEERYCDELELHRYAGLNLIRVWGGGTAERDHFYDCADRIGLLIYQEFWMTGDNNGRWAGNYSWPLNYDAYLANVKDTVKRLRKHPSLLFYGGCNECLAPRDSPWFPNPPRAINDGIQAILDAYDPGRFYIPSSMGGRNVADTFSDSSLYSNRTYSLASADGPYGMLFPSTYFDRNPGLSSNATIGFQPEIGSVSFPTFRGLLKMLDPTDIDVGYPRKGAVANNSAWTFHKFQAWTTPTPNGEPYDHVYAYFGSEDVVTARDWTAAAQLAAHAQYQHLFNGFVCSMFKYTTSVILWKSQSPWPSLRGFLYDWYLETTGTLRGVQAALGSPLSIAFDPKLWRLHLVNRHVRPLVVSKSSPVGAQFEWIDVHGEVVDSGTVLFPFGSIPAMSSRLLNEQLEWPRLCTAVCFLRLQVSHNQAYSSWYWLTNPSHGVNSDFSLLGVLRKRQQVSVALDVRSCLVDAGRLEVDVRISVRNNSTDVSFYPTLAIEKVSDETQLLPVFDSNETDVVILPGGYQDRRLMTRASAGEDAFVRVVLTSWNAADVIATVICTHRAMQATTA